MATHALPQALHQHPLAALYEVDPHSIVESKRDTRDIDTGQRHAPDHILRFAADTYGGDLQHFRFRLHFPASVIIGGIGHTLNLKKRLRGSCRSRRLSSVDLETLIMSLKLEVAVSATLKCKITT